MKVYLVWEYGQILAIYDSLEKALSYIENEALRSDVASLSIEEIEVQ